MRNASLVVLLVAAGCYAGPVVIPATPPPIDECPPRFDNAPKRKVDVLFVLDDTPSMAPKLVALRASLPRLVAAFDAQAQLGAPVWYHLGVVTSDLGAGPYTLDGARCRPGGDGGRLRNQPAAAAQPPAACGALTLSGGVRYLDDNQLAGSNNVGGGLDVATALACLTEVGSAGCDFRHPLEAAYRALHDPIPENQGFLRSDALLVVLFVSDADDCSASPLSDLFDPSAAGITKYGPLDRFRCTQFGIQCNGAPVPPMSVSGLTGCSSQSTASGGKLLDLSRYIDFFTRPAAQGGVKVDPNDVILAGIAAPADPVGVHVDTPCSDASAASCPVLNHSCVAPTNVTLFGDPAVRLRSVVASVKHNNLTSICDPSDDTPLDALAQLIASQTAIGCLGAPIADRPDGSPDCTVDDITANPDGSTTVTEIPSCAGNAHVVPCWQLDDKLPQYLAQGCTPPTLPAPPTCKLPATCQPYTDPRDGSPHLESLTIDRGPLGPPPTTTTTITCTPLR